MDFEPVRRPPPTTRRVDSGGHRRPHGLPRPHERGRSETCLQLLVFESFGILSARGSFTRLIAFCHLENLRSPTQTGARHLASILKITNRKIPLLFPRTTISCASSGLAKAASALSYASLSSLYSFPLLKAALSLLLG